MRKSLISSVAIAAVLLSIPFARSSKANEIYVCEDGRTLQVNSQNRQQMMQDPCIQAWFEKNGVHKKAVAEAEKKKKETGPQSMVGIPSEGSGSGGDFSGLIPLLFNRR